MTRSTKSAISILATLAIAGWGGALANGAEYGSLDAIVATGGETSSSSSPYRSLDAIVADKSQGGSGETAYRSLDGIVATGANPLPTATSAPASGDGGGVDWTDALLAAGVAISAGVVAIAVVGLRRRVRPNVQPTA